LAHTVLLADILYLLSLANLMLYSVYLQNYIYETVFRKVFHWIVKTF